MAHPAWSVRPLLLTMSDVRTDRPTLGLPPSRLADHLSARWAPSPSSGASHVDGTVSLRCCWLLPPLLAVQVCKVRGGVRPGNRLASPGVVQGVAVPLGQ